ncbi:DegT/DnrJ/EryC1/StrS family aminotransferase [bacterium]|nr:DegT/DnrJ/EryC1/StrS family aminotransferase [bacterium]
MKVPFINLKEQYATIRNEITQAMERVLDSQKFILDAEVAALEAEMCGFTSAKHAVACASGTDALLLSLVAVGVKAGDEIITSPFSFFATAGMITWLRAKPVFVDIDPETFNFRAKEAAAKVNSRTKAIIAVHLFGQCCRMENLEDVNLPVIEDACQSIGAERYGKQAGTMGTTGCFSFFPTKNLGGYGDGGMITTNDDSIAATLRQLRAHGQSNEPYLHERIGTNSRLDELQAAILRAKFHHLNLWNARRNTNARFYFETLKGVPIQLPGVDEGNQSIFHQFVIRVSDRDRLKSFLEERGIGTAIYYPVPLHLQPCFQYLGYKRGDLPEAEECSTQVLALPIYPELSQEQLEYVTETIRSFF